MSNNFDFNTSGVINYLTETEYLKFIKLKNEKQLELSDYTSIWKVMLYVLISQKIIRDESNNQNFFIKYDKFQKIKLVMDEYYVSAFTPELVQALKFAEEAKINAELIFKYFKTTGENKTNIEFTESRYTTNLMFIKKNFEDAIRSLKLTKNHVLFIDGIDIRPANISYTDYLECIKGLAIAIWEMNMDFFGSIKDSPGRLRVVLLMRPDILEKLNLPNHTNKIIDNSVLLDWRISQLGEFNTSSLFKMADTLLSSQQENRMREGEAWQFYCSDANGKNENIFIDMLRMCMFKPRDIISILRFLQQVKTEKGYSLDRFSQRDIKDNLFKSYYADYLIGQVNDYVKFYYSIAEDNVFLEFFQYLNGRSKFDYEYYVAAHFKFVEGTKNLHKPTFFDDKDKFLQFLYEVNIICYSEMEEGGRRQFFRWSYKERSFANLFPKVRRNSNYEIHEGILKALNLGLPIRQS